MIHIYGHGDGEVEVEGDVSAEFNTRPQTITVGNRAEGGIAVTMNYEDNGTWSAKVEMLGDGVRCPWGVNIGTREYTVRVTIDCPADTPVTGGRLL
jgi:hypothetical protein